MSLRASVVVVSRHRAEALRRCLVSLQQVWAVAFEVIVVADPAGIDAVGDMPGVIRIPFDAANIAQARNLGIDAARGDIISFIDDDAVAEPCW
ncbi:MAG: glycosyltransferase, partial [Pseudomonadota bacterium]